MELTLIQKIAVSALPIIFAITVHEAAHGYAAKYFGDLTAERMGRITLNPIKHIDPIGTILLPAITLVAGGVLFGWAKPVPVNWNQLNNKKRDIALVALAGPCANLLMIIFWLLIAKLFITAADQGNSVAHILTLMAWAGIVINSLLMILNLFPLPPLDGSRVVFSLLPEPMASRYSKIEPYGLIILVLLLVSGVLFKIIGPIIFGFQQLMYSIII